MDHERIVKELEARLQRYERKAASDDIDFERIAKAIGMSWCCTAETMELISRIEKLASQSSLSDAIKEVEKMREDYKAQADRWSGTTSNEAFAQRVLAANAIINRLKSLGPQRE